MKKIISLILAFCVVMGILPLTVFASMDDETAMSDEAINSVSIWDGSVASAFAGGSGTAADPYQIANGAQLAYLAKSTNSGNEYVNKYFVQTSDIDLNGIEWTPIGFNGATFTGIYDGNGHTIYNLIISGNYSKVGLFGGFNGLKISNLNLNNADVHGYENVGALVGSCWCDVYPYTYNVVAVENCKVIDSSIEGINNVGGIVGYSGTRRIVQSHIQSSFISGENLVGGIVGYGFTCNVSSCTSDSKTYVEGTKYVGGILGQATQASGWDTQAIYCANYATVVGETWIGGICGYGYNGYPVVQSFNAGDIYATGNTAAGGIGGNFDPGGSARDCYNIGIIVAPSASRVHGILGSNTRNSSGTYTSYNIGMVTDSSGSGYHHLSYSDWNNTNRSLKTDDHPNGSLTYEQFADQSSFVGWDFENVWIMNKVADRPLLRNNLEQLDPATCTITILDASTGKPIQGVILSVLAKENIVTESNEDGLIVLTEEGQLYSTDYSLIFYAEGYKDFMCFMSDLDVDGEYIKNNIVTLQPIGGEVTNTVFVDAHINFINSRFDSFYASNGFNNAYWQFDEGDSLEAYRIWNAVGDLGKVMTLDFEDLSINTDYYDLFISEYLLRMTDGTSYNIDKSITENYTKTYKKVTDGLAANLLALIEDDALLIKDITDAIDNKDNKTWKDFLHANDADLFKKDITKLINGKGDELDPTVRAMYNTIFSKYLNDEYYVEKLFNGAKKINTIASLCNDGLDAIEKIANSYIVAQTCKNVNEEIFDVLFRSYDYMRSINDDYAEWFKEDLDKYYSIATDDYALMEYIFNEFVSTNAELIWSNSQFKEALKDVTYRSIATYFDISLSQLKALVATYNGTYKLLDSAFKLSDKGDAYLFMNYVAPLEKAMGLAIDNFYGDSLLTTPTFENAIKYDYAYKCLAEINIYMYECLYKYASLFQDGLSNEATNSAAQCLMDLSTHIKNYWINTNCHSNIITNRYDYTAVQYPANEYDTFDEALAVEGDITLLADVSEVVTVNKEVSIIKNGFIANLIAGEGYEIVETDELYEVCAVHYNVPITGVSLNKTSTTLKVGTTETLIATVSPSNATNKAVTWTSSNTSVATVSSSGTVTAKAAGTATITVTTTDGAKTASCAIIVNAPLPNAIASGTCGDNLTWELTTDGEMSITGDGTLTDISSNVPWSEYRNTITAVTIGAGVTHIDNSLFRYCNNLTTIIVDEANPNYTSINGVLYTKNGETLVCYPAGKTDTSYNVPAGTTAIESYAFRTCENLTSVTIPDSVTTIGNYAFWGCENIESITIGKGVTSIGTWIFKYCDSLVSIKIDKGNTNYTDIDGVLYSKDMKTLISYPADKAGSSYTIPDGVTKITNYAFSGCCNLVELTVPASMSIIGNCVFDGCTKLTSINVTKGNNRYTDINGVLYNKDMTTLLYYPAGKTDTEFTVPETVTTIGRYSFNDCDSLVTVNIGTKVISIGYASFAYCDKLDAINYAGTESQWSSIPKGLYWNRYLDGDEVKFGA